MPSLCQCIAIRNAGLLAVSIALLVGACAPTARALDVDPARSLASAISVGQLKRLPNKGQSVRVTGIYWSAPRHCPPCPPRARCKRCAPPLAKFTDSTKDIGTKAYSPEPWTFVRDEDRCRPLTLGHRYVLQGTWTRTSNGSRYMHIKACQHVGTDSSHPVDHATSAPDRRPTSSPPPRRRAPPGAETTTVRVRFAPVRTRCGGSAPRPEELRYAPVTQTRLTIERARPITQGTHRWSQYAVVTTNKRGAFTTTLPQGWAYRATRKKPHGSHRGSCIFAYRRLNPRVRCIFSSTYVPRCNRRGPGIPGRP